MRKGDAMENETYMILRDFIKTAGYTNKDFAKLAQIPPSTFQSILDRKSEKGIKTDTLGKILDAMAKIQFNISQAKDEERAEKLEKYFYSFVNSIQSPKLHAFYEFSSIGTVPKKDGFFFLFGDILHTESVSEMNKRYAHAKELFCELNTSGQKEIVRTMEEMTKDPQYQKKDGE